MAQLAALASALLRSTNAPDAGPYAANGKTQMGEFFGERLGGWCGSGGAEPRTGSQYGKWLAASLGASL